MPALVRLAGQHRGSLEALVALAGIERVRRALESTRDTEPLAAIPENVTPTPQESRDHAFLDRLMRQRAEGPLGSAV